jgi:hypothetical protein
MTLVHGDGSYDSGDWVTFSFEPDAATNNYDWDARKYFAFGHEFYTHKEGSSVTAQIYGVDCGPAETLLFADSSNSRNVFGRAFSGWYNQGSTVASGNGKRSEYDTKQCSKFKFSVPGSSGTVTNPDGRTSLLALLQSTGKNQGSSNTGSAIWDTGHKDLYYSSRTGSAFGSESHMTLVHGDGSYDSGDWVTFSFEPDAATNNYD